MPPFIQKDTKIPADKRSVCQLLEIYSEDKNGNPNKYKISAKAHTTLFPKNVYRFTWKRLSLQS